MKRCNKCGQLVCECVPDNPKRVIEQLKIEHRSEIRTLNSTISGLRQELALARITKDTNVIEERVTKLQAEIDRLEVIIEKQSKRIASLSEDEKLEKENNLRIEGLEGQERSRADLAVSVVKLLGNHECSDGIRISILVKLAAMYYCKARYIDIDSKKGLELIEQRYIALLNTMSLGDFQV